MPRFTNPRVGVGADDEPNIFQQLGARFFEDEDARKRREVLEDAAHAQQLQQQGLPPAQAEARVQQERQFTPDPLRWVQERAEDTRRNPIIGGLRSLGALPEAAGTAARYATGVVLAPVQAGAQAYGWNAQGAASDIASGTQYLPGADWPIMGGLARGAATLGGIGASALGTAGRTGTDLLTGNVPQQQVNLAGQPVWDMSPTTVPTWENPFDPREALQRSRALAGPGELAPELVSGGAVFGPMGRGLRTLGGEALGGLGPDTRVLQSVHGNPVADLFAPGRGALGATIPPLVGAAAGAIAPIIPGKPADEETTITDRLMGAGEGFLLGGLLGMAASPLERRLIPMAGAPGRPTITPDVDAYLRSQPGGNTVADSLLPELFQANARVQGFEGRAVTPGGSMQNAIDGLVSAFHDPLARVGTLMSWADQELADRLRLAGVPVPQGQSVLGDAGNAFVNLANSRSIRQRMQPLIADMQQNIKNKGGAIYDSENDWFNVLATMEMMSTASTLQQPKFMGSYLTTKRALVPGFGEATASAMTQAELLADRDLVRGAIQRAFPDRIDQYDAATGKQVAWGVLSRMDATRSGLAELSNRAMDALADGGVLEQSLVDNLRNRFGDQYVYLQSASTHYTEIRPKANAGPDYLASQRLIGSLHNDVELPAFTIGGQLQRVQNAIALAEHNKGMNNLADTMYMLGDFRTDPQTAADISLGIPGLVEPNRKVPKAVPGPATYERIQHDPTGAPVLDTNGQPVMETVTRPGATNMAMVYADNVDKDMGLLPYFDHGDYRELLVERSLAETLNGANLETQNAATRLVAEQAKFFARGVTGMAPFFSIMHGLRQFQEFVEKAPSGELGRSMAAYFNAMYATFTQPLADFAATHPQNPIVASLPGAMARALDRGFGGDPKRALADLFHSEGGGGATLPAQLARTQTAMEMIGGRAGPGWQGRLPQGAPAWLMKPIQTYFDANQAVTGLFDELPRLATFDVVLQQGARQGLTPAEALPGALYKARTFTNDYGRMGTSMVVLNSIFPLLNARKEGFITSLGGALEDPQKFATRLSFWIGLPAVTTYAANRLAYGDAYDDIPVEEKDMYFHVPYGWWQDDTGRDHPLTLKVVKSPFIQAITAPIEQLLDSQYHLAKDQEYLAENQRTSRPDARMWLTSLARMTPLEGQPDMAADVKHLAFAAASMQPLVSMAVEMASNEDHFTGRDIIPPEKRLIPPQYQYGVGTSTTAKLAGKYLHQSPGVLDQFAADMFGTAGRSAMHVPDLAVGILQKHGLLPGGDPFAPQTAADLPNLAGLPPEVVNRYLDQMQHEDMRPWQGQFLPRFFGTAYSGRSIQARAKQLGPEEKERWEDTLEYDRHRREITVAYSRKRSDLETQAPDITNAAYRDKLWQLTMQEKGAREELANTYAGRAWTSPAERQAAINAMPGTSVDGFQKSLAQLPPGTDVAALAGQWEAIGQQGNAPTVASMRNRWLQQTSQQLHVPASTILDYLGAHHLGNELVGLPAPVEDLERLRTEHAAPMDPNDPTRQLDPFTTPADKFRAAQRAVIANYASMWGVPEGNLLERLNARYHLPGETVGPVQAQQQLASMVETRFHNPAEYPRYSSPSGQAVGTPDDWTVWDAQLDNARNKYGDQRNRWPGAIRILDDARRYGNAHRYMDMYRHATDGEPAEREAGLAQLVAWETYYGTGRNATLNEWRSFMSDGQTKYKADLSPQTALSWDALYQTYRLLPPGPEKNRYRPFAERIRRTMNPRWQRIIDERDEAGAELQQT